MLELSRDGSVVLCSTQPLLVLLLIGFDQRLAAFAHPEWHRLQSGTRLLTNGASVASVYPILPAYPHVLPIDASAAPLARGISNLIWWGLFPGFGLYGDGGDLYVGIQLSRRAAPHRQPAATAGPGFPLT